LDLNEIYKPVKNELAAVENGLSSVGIVDAPWLNEILGYALKGGGKRLRPALVILAANLYDYNQQRILPMAMSVELMHLATLVHDDTIDKSSVRWGRPTINRLYGDEKAVLLGDYIFAKAGSLAASTENLHAIKLFSHTLMIISNGELAQAAGAFKIEQTLEHYLFRISCKTAALFILSLESGAVLGKAPPKSVQILHDYAHNLGIVFQIIDDILDFTSTEEEMGKPVGSDLYQGTMTLPSMLLVKRYPSDNPVKRLFEGGDKKENIRQATEMIRNSSIIQECFDIADRYRVKACEKLGELPEKEVRKSLFSLADFFVTRKR
jgi:geranylgeranyl pyrophosphate synthase